ncbi:MAG: glycosyltransferase [Fimbriiglobus sp.]|jgi:hypothetical protein|nr:glycosyltransferase [Fimbriiglobus sp.]
MTRVLALCSPADVTGSVRQFDLAWPLLRERFEVVRHTLPANVKTLLPTVQPDLIHTLGAAAFRAMRQVAIDHSRPGGRPLPPWLAAGAAAVEPALGFCPGLTATFSQAEHERDWAARLTPAPMQFSGPVGVARPVNRERPGASHSIAAPTCLASPTILAAGGFDSVAHLKHIVWAFDVLKYPHPQLQLVILGDGPLRREVEQFARSLGFDDLRVQCVGFQADPSPWLCNAIQAWSCHSRGGAKFLLDAMAAGVPVLATRTPDTERLIRDGENGRLVPVGRPVEMARVAHSLLSSPDAAKTLVVRGEATAGAHPVADLADAFAGVYHSLTSTAPSRHE